MKGRLVAVLSLILITGSAKAQYSCVKSAGFHASSFEQINFYSTHPTIQGYMPNGAGVWNYGCPRLPNNQTSNGLPYLSTASGEMQGPSLLNVEVRYNPGMSTAPRGACGLASIPTSGGYIVPGGWIDVWERYGSGAGALAGTPCPSDLGTTLGHEFGHFLNLDDLYNDPNYSSCSPSSSIMWSGASPSSNECRKADESNVTPSEQSCSCCFDDCTPIVIDIGDTGFALTDLEGGVTFDMDADGDRDRTSWTAPTSGNAFLALDRDGSRTITSASELFGNHTPSNAGGVCENGFVALSEYDQTELGGNSDGLIDAKDHIWPWLLLWTDRNQNGVSEESELQPISSSAIVAIDTKFSPAPRLDEHGNRYGYKGRAWRRDKHGRSHPVQVFDFTFMTTAF
jgi:hypothetical protein